MPKTKSGFTIVELLIVIVVIAILAAISIVAYNGIQNRTHDTTVQHDLRQTYNKLQLYKVDNGNYPAANSNIDLNAVFTVSRQSYGGGGNAVLYCISDADVAVVGRSKSGTGFYASSANGQGKMSTWPGDGNANLCPVAGVAYNSPGYTSRWIYVNGAWETWFTTGR